MSPDALSGVALTAGGTGAHRAFVPLVLDLLRHGAAHPALQGGDEARRLSPRGRADLERLASHLAGMGWRPDRAFASPLVRARESARTALREAAPALTVEVMEALRPDSEPEEVLLALEQESATEGHVFLVAHQPLLGLLAESLCPGAVPGFSPGCMVRIEFAGTLGSGAGMARWHLPPGFAV
jgi:phosphohistidine phosphatase SixA